MKHPYLLFSLFFLLSFSLSSYIPTSITERDTLCKQRLQKAAFGDINYKEKITLYDSLIPLLSFGVSNAIEKKYIAGLKKVFLARSENSFENNKMLEQLFFKVRSLPSLKKEYSTLDSWIEALNKNNQSFALQTNDKIALYLPEFKGYFRPFMQDEMIITKAGPFPAEASQPHPSIIFSISKKDSEKSPLISDQEYLLTPLYCQKATDAFPLFNSKPFTITFQKKKYLQTNIYDKELLQITFAEPISISQQLTPLWAKIEKIENESLFSIENQHFAYQIKKLKLNGSPEELITHLKTMLTLFNTRISENQKTLVMQELRNLTDKKDILGLKTLQHLRNMCAQAITYLPSGNEKKECKRWISEINQAIEKNALCFNDIVILNAAPNNRIFTRLNRNSSTEPLLLSHADPTKSMHAIGTELMKISSPALRNGIIRYGDEITLTPLYASENGTITQLAQTDGLARRQKDMRGNICHYLGCAPINLSQAPQKTTFTLMPPPELASLKKMGACCTNNDSFLLMHQASQAFVSLNKNAQNIQPYIFSQEGSAFFMQKPSEELLNQINALLVKKELFASTQSTLFSKKIAHLQKLTSEGVGNFNEKTSKKIWANLEEIFNEKKNMTKNEVSSYIHALLKISQRLTAIDPQTKNHLIAHACFYQKMKTAESKTGAARLACYHELIPFLKKYPIDAEYKTALLEKIKDLHERKTTEFSSLEKLLELTKND